MHQKSCSWKLFDAFFNIFDKHWGDQILAFAMLEMSWSVILRGKRNKHFNNLCNKTDGSGNRCIEHDQK